MGNNAIVDSKKKNSISVQDIIKASFSIPGVYINRDEFLRKEFVRYYSKECIEDAVKTTPAQAGIDSKIIDKLSASVIRFERLCVSGISVALGVPGGWAMAATVPADLAQYFAYTLRAAQKLLYLYGFPQISKDKADFGLDTETMNELILCLGVMFGVSGANHALKALAIGLGNGVEKKLLNTALTKGSFFPLISSIVKWFGVKLTKGTFASVVKHSIPVASGFISGGITFATFSPCCKRLKESIKDTYLSNTDYHPSPEEEKLYDAILSSDKPADGGAKD